MMNKSILREVPWISIFYHISLTWNALSHDLSIDDHPKTVTDYAAKDRFCPVEVKWTGQLRPKQLRQIAKYPNALILAKSREGSEIQGVQTSPLPLELLRLGPSPVF
jgi:hypothetical protein